MFHFKDIERLKLRHRKRSRLQNKEIILHFVAKHDSCANFYTEVLSVAKNQPVVSTSPDMKLNLVPRIKQQGRSKRTNFQTYAHFLLLSVNVNIEPAACRSLVLIQDSDEETSISSSSGYSSVSNSIERKSNSPSPTPSSSLAPCPSEHLSTASSASLSSSSSNMRTLEVRLRMFEGLISGLKKVLEVATPPTSDSCRPASPRLGLPPPSPNHHRAPIKHEPVILESSLTKTSAIMPRPTAEFAPAITSTGKASIIGMRSASTVVPDRRVSGGLVRVRNVNSMAEGVAVSPRRSIENATVVVQQNRPTVL